MRRWTALLGLFFVAACGGSDEASSPSGAGASGAAGGGNAGGAGQAGVIIGYSAPGSFKTVVLARQPGTKEFSSSEREPANMLRVAGSSKGISTAYTQ